MKLVTSLATGLLVCSCSIALAAAPTKVGLDLAELQAQKDANITGVPDPQLNVGGEDIGSATNIPGLPYSDSGNTCTFVDNYDEVCPFTTPGSADVVYQYSPAASGAIDIDLCNSLYDTKLYVYENAAGNLVGCNDDACGTDGFKSALEGVPVTAGNTYYIVVDGYNFDCGDYEMTISENVPCIVDCPPGSIAENEPDCFDNYVDATNGGCNSVPPVFSNLPCNSAGVSVCGKYGGFLFNGLSYRDTDWYQLQTAGDSNVTMCVEGEIGTLMGVIDGNLGCPVSFFEASLTIGDCDPGCITLFLTAGTWWFFVAPSDFGSVAGPCGADYTMTIDGADCGIVSVENASWGNIKDMYR